MMNVAIRNEHDYADVKFELPLLERYSCTRLYRSILHAVRVYEIKNNVPAEERYRSKKFETVQWR